MRLTTFTLMLSLAGCGNPSAVIPSSSSPSVTEVKPVSNEEFKTPATVANIEATPTKPVAVPTNISKQEEKKTKSKLDPSKLNDDGLIKIYRLYQSQHENLARAIDVLEGYGKFTPPDKIAELHSLTRERIEELEEAEAAYARYWAQLGLKLLGPLKLGSLKYYQDR